MPIAKKNDIPQDFLDQMKSNLKKETETAANTNQTAGTQTVETVTANRTVTPVENKKGKYADVMNIRLSEGRRDEIKKFCTNCGITVTQYIESSFEFLAKEVAAGRVVISKGGISKVEE